LTTAAGVLAVGFSLAWLVGRRPATLSDRAVEMRSMQHSLDEASFVRPASESPSEFTTSVGQLEQLKDASDAPGAIDETTGAATQKRPYSDVATPSRSRTIQPVDPPTLPPRLDSEAWNAAIDMQRTADQTALGDAAKTQAVAHVIHNGDTLERLAQRYLGDERRAIEIFELNRDVLKNPHVLPIGAELQIHVQPAGT